MALIGSALTTLVLAKDAAGIPSGNTADDTFLERRINALSISVASYCDRIFGGASDIPSYTEILAPPNRQLLQVRQWPIVAVTSIDDNGFALTLNTDYRCDAQDKARGHIYRENGWIGNTLVTGLTMDPVANERSLTVVYTAGYYLPGDATHYIEGNPASLPLDLVLAVSDMVAEAYYMVKRQAHGLKSYSEGGISFSFKDACAASGHTETLNKYRRWL